MTGKYHLFYYINPILILTLQDILYCGDDVKLFMSWMHHNLPLLTEPQLYSLRDTVKIFFPPFDFSLLILQARRFLQLRPDTIPSEHFSKIRALTSDP